MRNHAVKAEGQRLDLEAAVFHHLRDVLRHHGQEDDVLVQHLVVAEVVYEYLRGAARVRGEEDRGAGHPRRRLLLHLSEELLERHRASAEHAREEAGPPPPRRHDQEDRGRDEERYPASMGDLWQIGGEERELDREKACRHERRAKGRPAPAPARDHVEEEGGHRHRAGDRDAVRAAERAGRPERQHEEQAAERQAGVDLRNVDLAELGARGVDDRQPGRVAELDRLLGERERAGDERL